MGEEEVAKTVSGAASSTDCVHTLKANRKRNEVKTVSLIVVV